jgi:GT2 family glycosyltransferase
MRPSFGCVVLTEGRRPEQLADAIRSLERQRDVDVDIVVVGNGWAPDRLPEGVKSLALQENVGVPAGRNAGLAAVAGDLLLFLDDDASFPDDDALSRIAAMFADHARLAAISPRLVDPAGRMPPRRWVPRLRAGDPARSSQVTVVTEGAIVVRRTALEKVGDWPGHFYRFHEGIDLAWRLWDAGYTIWYAGDVVALHPAPVESRRGEFRYLSSRNRVWLARRRLPLPLAGAHAAIWFARSAAGVRSAAEAQALLRGYYDGLVGPAGERAPLRWRTAWRMTLAGRPPVI